MTLHQMIPYKLAPQPERPLRERVAEARKFRGQISEIKFHRILNAIYGSAVDFGEISIERSRCPPEIAAPDVLTITKIQTVVAEHFELTRDELLSSQHVQRIVIPRQIAMYLSNLLLPQSFGLLVRIGRRFGRNHTTVLHSVRKIKKLLRNDLDLAKTVEELKEMLS